MKFTRDKNHLSYIADVGCDFSITHCKGLAAAIFSRSVKVGNDAESLRRRIEFKDFLIALAADEVKSIYAEPSHDVELLRLLTRKEACWKHTAEEKPYKELSTVLKNQAIFNYKNLDGTVVALYCPNYVTGLNAPGWHLHFVSADRTKGGHVLAVAIKLAEAEIDTTAQWTIDLPEKSAPFAGLKLETDLAKETKEVGTKH